MLSLTFILLSSFLAVCIAADVNENDIVYRNGALALQDEKKIGQRILRTPPYKELSFRAEDIPENWDWRDVDGKSYVTASLNQHIPVYCGSCWAHAALSSIADRIKIQTKGTMADIIPAVQVMINCGTAGSCNGGDSNAANAWVAKNDYGGIPDVTCQQYEAVNNDCKPENVCRNCNYTMVKRQDTCFAVDKYPKFTVSEFGSVRGDDDIMAEIYTRGPVSCYIDAGPIEDYTGGVASYAGAHGTNHAIQLAGFGVEEDGTKYWILRNSWGGYWGDNGWAKIKRGDASDAYKPGQCFWAVPDIEGY